MDPTFEIQIIRLFDISFYRLRFGYSFVIINKMTYFDINSMELFEFTLINERIHELFQFC